MNFLCAVSKRSEVQDSSPKPRRPQISYYCSYTATKLSFEAGDFSNFDQAVLVCLFLFSGQARPFSYNLLAVVLKLNEQITTISQN